MSLETTTNGSVPHEVYSAPAQWTTFIQGEVIDETFDIRISLAELFA
jgi:hypothetical protein